MPRADAPDRGAPGGARAPAPAGGGVAGGGAKAAGIARVISAAAPAPALTPLEKYHRYRDMQVEINEDVLKNYVDDDRLRAAAGLLGLGTRGGKIEVDGDDIPALYDFSINDVRRGGKAALESYVEGIGGIESVASAARRRLLRAMLSAKTSLYRVDGADPAARTVELADLLGGGAVTIHDRGMSTTEHAGLGIFARIIALPSISMTAGASAVFAPRDVQRALSAYRRLEKGSDRRPEIKRYALFFRMYLEFGLQARYGDCRTGKEDRYEDSRTRPPA